MNRIHDAAVLPVFCAQQLTPTNQSAPDSPPAAWRPSIGLDKVGIFSHRATTSCPPPPESSSQMPRSPMIVHTVPALWRALDGLRSKKATIALVPTMGALHDGHVSLVRLAKTRATITRAGFILDYFDVRHAETLAPIGSVKDGPMRILVAAKIGRTRLIDNIAV